MNLTLGPVNKSIDYKFNLFEFRGKGLTVQGMLGSYDSFGVYTSGGLDSTILLCMLMSELKTIGKLQDVDITCFTVCKTSGSTYYADRMHKILCNLFEKDIKHVTNIDNPYLNVVPTPLTGDMIDIITNANKKMLFFLGVNAYPHKNEKTFSYGGHSIFHEPTLKDMRVAIPFSKLLKYHILDLYYKLGYEDLIQYTHSCTADPFGMCNACLGCEERAWAFEVLGKKDDKFVPPEVDDVTFGGTYKYV